MFRASVVFLSTFGVVSSASAHAGHGTADSGPLHYLFDHGLAFGLIAGAAAVGLLVVRRSRQR